MLAEQQPVSTQSEAMSFRQRYDHSLSLMRATVEPFGKGAAGKALRDYGNDLLKVLAPANNEVRDEMFVSAVKRQSRLLGINAPELNQAVYDLTDAARNIFPENPYVGIIGLVHDYRRMGEAETPEEFGVRQQSYVETYMTIRGANNPEVDDLLSSISATLGS